MATQWTTLTRFQHPKPQNPTPSAQAACYGRRVPESRQSPPRSMHDRPTGNQNKQVIHSKERIMNAKINNETVPKSRAGSYTNMERHPEEDKGGDAEGRRFKARGKQQNRWAGELPGVSFWYMKSCISYILRRARAFYNEFCCGTLEDPMVGSEALSVGPYFSIPVIPPPNVPTV